MKNGNICHGPTGLKNGDTEKKQHGGILNDMLDRGIEKSLGKKMGAHAVFRGQGSEKEMSRQ